MGRHESSHLFHNLLLGLEDVSFVLVDELGGGHAALARGRLLLGLARGKDGLGGGVGFSLSSGIGNCPALLAPGQLIIPSALDGGLLLRSIIAHSVGLTDEEGMDAAELHVLNTQRRSYLLLGRIGRHAQAVRSVQPQT